MKDKKQMQKLYYKKRWSFADIGLFYGKSRQRIREVFQILSPLTPLFDRCDNCDSEDPKHLYYIDGDTNNGHPHNIALLCDLCVPIVNKRRRIRARRSSRP